MGVCLLDDLKAFGINARGDSARRQDKWRNVSWRNGSLQRKLGLDCGMQ